MNKVYCSRCRYFKGTGDFGGMEYCKHPNNQGDSYYEPNAYMRERPEVKNKNNACHDFAPTRTFFQLLLDQF